MLTCKQKALRAGKGMMAAIKKADPILIDVSKTLTPTHFKHSPV